MARLRPPSLSPSLLPLSLLLLLALPALSQSTYPTWCGKYYLPGAPTTLPSSSSRFPTPSLSPTPLLDFRCAPSVRPFVIGDSGSVLLDLGVGNEVGVPWEGGTEDLEVELWIGEERVGGGSVGVNSTGVEMGIELGGLEERRESYELRCVASSGGERFERRERLWYLPLNEEGSTTKMNARTGGILVPVEGGWEPLFPLGFYSTFQGYLDTNLSALDEMAANGINIVHPVPTYDNATALELALDRMEELGLWLMYDMRWTYEDSASVTEQVNLIKSRKNLLLWYTADEPDGSGDPLNATQTAYDLVTSLDPYHPVSVALNCDDFEWSSYASGADIVLADPYPLYNDITYSKRYDTVCTPDFGCCGCDNCAGSASDVSTRLDNYYDRIRWSGRSRNLTVWGTLQAFDGTEEFWTGTPTGQEYLAMAILAINHGATGIVSWNAPTTPSILFATSQLGAALPLLTPYLLNPSSTLSIPSSNSSLDLALWTLSTRALLLVANPLNESISAEVSLPGEVKSAILDGGARWEEGVLLVGSYGVGGWEVEMEAGGAVARSEEKSAGSRLVPLGITLPWDREL